MEDSRICNKCGGKMIPDVVKDYKLKVTHFSLPDDDTNNVIHVGDIDVFKCVDCGDYAYTDAQLEKIIELNKNSLDKLDKIPLKCRRCGSEMHVSSVNRNVSFDGTLVSLEIPAECAYVCDKCGEFIFDEAYINSLINLINIVKKRRSVKKRPIYVPYKEEEA